MGHSIRLPDFPQARHIADTQVERVRPGWLLPLSVLANCTPYGAINAAL